MIGIPLFVYIPVLILAAFVIVALVYFIYRSAPPTPPSIDAQLPQGPQNNAQAGGANRRQNIAAKIKKSKDNDDAGVAKVGGARKGGMNRMRRRINTHDDGEDMIENNAIVVQERQDIQLGEDEAAEIEREIVNEKKAGLAPTKRVGAKKQRKEQEKEEKRHAHEALQERKAQQRAREEQEEKERLQRKADEAAEAKRVEEEERLIREERERKAKEELAQWREMFEVEAEGSIKNELDERKQRMLGFADHVKNNKVSKLEDLAVAFDLKTHEVLAEIERLESEGILSGVVDERGKYIYITPEEMDAVVKFVKKKGRARIEDIARESNRLIELNPKQ